MRATFFKVLEGTILPSNTYDVGSPISKSLVRVRVHSCDWVHRRTGLMFPLVQFVHMCVLFAKKNGLKQTKVLVP